MIAIPTLILIAVGAVLAYVAMTDLTEARIPNIAMLLLILFGVAHVVAQGGDPSWNVGVAVATFACTFFLWQVGVLGGGDVKLLTGVALVLGIAFPAFLAAMGAFAVCLAVSRGWLPKLWQKRRDIPAGVIALPAFAIVAVLS